MRTYLLLLPCLLLCFVSCRSTSGMAYFNQLDASESTGMEVAANYELKIAPDDMLSITVASSVLEAVAQYNLPAVSYSTPGQTNVTVIPNLQVYTVDRDGDIYFPVIGKIHVEGLTRRELARYIEGRIAEAVEDPLVIVQFMNFKVVVLGEVMRPGPITMSSERISILDAIGAAGDLTIYGMRENVLLIREEDGKRVFQRFDLSDPAIFSSPYYYLKQNDVVYVEPNKAKKGASHYDQNASFKVSVASVVVSTLSVLASLAIALFIRK